MKQLYRVPFQRDSDIVEARLQYVQGRWETAGLPPPIARVTGEVRASGVKGGSLEQETGENWCPERQIHISIRTLTYRTISWNVGSGGRNPASSPRSHPPTLPPTHPLRKPLRSTRAAQRAKPGAFLAARLGSALQAEAQSDKAEKKATTQKT
ncbi:hypothetical protein AAFF_G00177900 [Aldrovandia affinis]|uniref:Uncharacterized protein n=1 Tax=Aldrovandia affinis TaxID=143900 RepID=A0AAD7RKM8_9TELE|nr:hypothetical protein AAFF_G00177900 [Aldrovandia affinis]